MHVHITVYHNCFKTVFVTLPSLLWTVRYSSVCIFLYIFCTNW